MSNGGKVPSIQTSFDTESPANSLFRWGSEEAGFALNAPVARCWRLANRHEPVISLHFFLLSVPEKGSLVTPSSTIQSAQLLSLQDRTR
jgi:hypothetical protein